MAKTAKAPRRSIALGATAMSTTKHVESVTVGDGFSASVNGLIVTGEPAFDAWPDVGKRLRILERGGQFAIGDYLNAVEDRFGEEASQIVDASDWSIKTCSVYRWLAQSIAIDVRRMDRLGVAHHLLVAPLAPAKQREWLTKAAADDTDLPWTVAHLRASLQAGEELKATGFWVLVACDSERAQRKFIDQMEKAGRVCKAVTRRERASKKQRGTRKAKAA